MKELRDPLQETGRRFPSPQATRADAENFALFVATSFDKGRSMDNLINGVRNECGEWFANCPAVLKCSIRLLIEKAKVELKHWFIVAEERECHSGRMTHRFYYDFEKGRFDMSTIRKISDEKKADANKGAKPKTEAKAKALMKKAKKAKAVPKSKAKAEFPKAAPKAAATEKKADKGRPEVTLVLQSSVGGNYFAEFKLPDGRFKYFHMRRNLTSLFDICKKVNGAMYKIVKIDVMAELNDRAKAEMKTWGEFE